MPHTDHEHQASGPPQPAPEAPLPPTDEEIIAGLIGSESRDARIEDIVDDLTSEGGKTSDRRRR